MPITIKHLEDNIKTLPEDLYGEVNDFVDFLKTKYESKNSKDWSENLTNYQKNSIEKGISNIENGRTYSHEEAKQTIKNYLLEKSK
jgi:DNA replication initiation complex subunit (GINS family)